MVSVTSYPLPGNWLSVFDNDDKAEFFSAVRASLDLAERRGDIMCFDSEVRAWKVTAEALSDPQRREVLTVGEFKAEDFAEVRPPGTCPDERACMNSCGNGTCSRRCQVCQRLAWTIPFPCPACPDYSQRQAADELSRLGEEIGD